MGVISKKRRPSQDFFTPTKVARTAMQMANLAYKANQQSPYLYGPYGTTIGKKNQFRFYKNFKTTTTPQGTIRRLRKNGGAVMSRSRGFLKKGASIRRYNRKKLVKYSNYGVNKTVEAGKVQTGVDCVWIGHATFARGQVYRQVVMAMFQAILNKAMIIRSGTAVDQELNMIVGDSIAVSYNNGTADASETYNFAAGQSIGSVVNWFTDSARPWNSDSTVANAKTQYEFTLNQILVTANNTRMVFDCASIKVAAFMKSSMKIQNRSRAAAGTTDAADDAENIDNVPLYGKSYSGNGNHLRSNRQPGNDIYADALVGHMQGSESAIFNSRREPPHPRDFIGVKHCGKAHFDPGEIKTSVLYDKATHYINTWMRIIADTTGILAAGSTIAVPTRALARARFNGKFRVFALEKMIDVGAAEPISCAFEVNYEISTRAIIQANKTGLLKEFDKYALA